MVTTTNSTDQEREAYAIARASGILDFMNEDGMVEATLIGSPTEHFDGKWDCEMKAHNGRLYIPAPIGYQKPWFPYRLSWHVGDALFEGSNTQEKTTTYLDRNLYLFFYGRFSRFQEYTKDGILKMEIKDKAVLAFSVDHEKHEMRLVGKEHIEVLLPLRI